MKPPRAPLLIAIEGPSGAGKTTASRALARALGGLRLEEAYWRASPRPRLRFRNDAELLAIERELFAEELRRFQDAQRAREAGRWVVLDTDFFGPLTYVWGLEQLALAGTGVLPRIAERYLRAQARHRWEPPDLTVYLAVAPETALERAALAPRRHPVRLRERHLRVGRAERQLYLSALAPVMRDRWAYVSAAGTPDQVVSRILRAVPSELSALPSVNPLGVRLVKAILGFRRPIDRGPSRHRTRAVPGNR